MICHTTIWISYVEECQQYFDAASPFIGRFIIQKNSIKDELSAFFTETSFTALTQIYKANSIWKRVVWTVLVIGMLAWMVVQCYWLFEKYYKYPIEVMWVTTGIFLVATWVNAGMCLVLQWVNAKICLVVTWASSVICLDGTLNSEMSCSKIRYFCDMPSSMVS